VLPSLLSSCLKYLALIPLDANGHPGHVRFHQDLLFPRPEELNCSSNPLSGLFCTHRMLLYDLPLPYREIGTRVIASPTLGSHNPRTPMKCSPTYFLALIGNYPVGKSVHARSQITHLVNPPIPDLRCHLSSTCSVVPHANRWLPRYRLSRPRKL
jgi:hypothetical protein